MSLPPSPRAPADAAAALIEDRHQGRLSHAAAARVEAYRRFVAAQDAPIARMNYSPFAKPATQQQVQARNAQPPSNSARRSSMPDLMSARSSSYDAPTVSSAARAARSAPGTARNSIVGGGGGAAIAGANGAGHLSARGSLSNKAGGAAGESQIKHALGGGSWSVSKNGGGSKRGSRVSSAGASRKSSFSLFGGDGSKSARGSIVQHHEREQSIWAVGVEQRALAHLPRSVEKELQDSSVDRLAEPKEHKRLSLKQPFLRAHASEARFQPTPAVVTAGGVGLGGGAAAAGPASGLSKNKAKRMSMPPLQNRRGSNASLSNGANGWEANLNSSRRGSLSSVAGSVRGPREAVLRARSQSLPCDSLFVAYSSCALPAVMTSSLAAMPVPKDPAIPVKVARRYSILGEHAADHQPALLDEAAADVQNVDPEVVDGIDTLSTLDTSQLRDLSPDGSDLDEYDDSPSELNSTGGSDSRQTPRSVREPVTATPASSPVGDTQPISAYPLAAALAAVTEAANNGDGASSGNNSARSVNSGRSRSVIHPAPVRAQSESLSTPDFTPLTSPTNLSHASFKGTLLTRRMSDVVARDIAKKLRVLKQHVAVAEGQHDDDSAAASAPNKQRQ